MNHKNNQSGFSTLEILIAFAILTISVTAVILVVFGNQSSSTSSQTNGEALYQAQHLLEDARASSSHTNFLDIVTATSSSDIYGRKISVLDISPCSKQVTGTVAWNEGSRALSTSLSTLLTDPEEAILLGGNCTTNPPPGGWTHPNTLLSRDLNYHAAYNDNTTVNSSAGNQATGISVMNKIIYMSAGVSAAAAKDDFFVLDGSNVISGVIPPILGSINTGPGLNGVTVQHDIATGKTFAYVLQNTNQHQFEVIDVTTPTTIGSPMASASLPNVTFTCSPASDPCLSGKSIFYYAGKVYIGTNYIANLALPPTQNNEFHVFCVAPDATIPSCVSSSPYNPGWAGSVNINHNVNAIAVQGHYAFLATSDDAGELTVVDLNNLAAPVIKFDAPGSEDGTSVSLIGNKLYLGREQTPASRKDFYILDVSKLPIISESGSKYLAQNSNTDVAGISVSGKYAFLALTDPNQGFQVLDISTPGSIQPIGKYNYSEEATGIVFENDFVYTSNQKNDALRIIRPAQCADTVDDDGDGKIDIGDPQCHTDGNVNNTTTYNPEDDNE